MSDELVATGLAGLTVTAAVTEPIPRPSIAPTPVENMSVEVPAVPLSEMPEGWTIHKSASLVREIAQNMYDLPTILAKFQLDQGQYDRLKDNEFFKKAVEATTIEWNAPQNTKKRLALEAAIALEDALPDVAARLKKSNEPLPGIVQLVKVLSEIAGVTGQATQGQPSNAGAQFKITFNLGADQASFAKRAPAFDPATLQPLPERAGTDAALQQLIAPA